MISISKLAISLSEKQRKILLLAGFLLLFLGGLFMTGDYGQHVDENNQFVLVYANMKEYALKLADGGMKDDIIKWFDDRNIVEISASENLDHGIAAYYPIATFLLTDQLSHGLMLKFWNGYTFCLFFLGVIALYFIGKYIFQAWQYGVFTALCFYLTPRMFAEGHYNNKDLILLCLALVSVWMGLWMAEKKSVLAAIVMGLSAAFAANIKIVGAWPFALLGLFYLWKLTVRKEWNLKTFSVGLTAVVSFFVVYVLITPACWADPVGFLGYLTGNAKHFARWDDDVLFRGALYKHSRNPLPRTYLFQMMGLTVPVYVLFFAVVGQGMVLYKGIRQLAKKSLDENTAFLLVTSIWWIAPLGAATISQTLVYNSWRHFYFCYGAIVLLAVYGVKQLAEVASVLLNKQLGERLVGKKQNPQKQLAKKGVLLVFAGCLLFTGFQSLKNHPYEYAYFNFLAGKQVENRYEIDYWAIGGKSALEELYRTLPYERGDLQPGQQVLVAACDITTQIGMENGWVNLPASVRNTFVCTEDWQNADFVVVNTTYSKIEQLRGNLDSQSVMENWRKVCQITAYGNEIWSVYAR